jgi:hypothetical protein
MSFFKQFPQIDYDIQQNGEISKIYDIYRHVDVVNKKTDDFTSYTFYEIKDGDRPDIISQKLYGTPDYYWTFFIINDFLQHGYNYFYKSYQTFMRGLQLEYEGKGALVVLPNYDTSFNVLGGIDITNDIIKVGRNTTVNDYELLNMILRDDDPSINAVEVRRNIDAEEENFTVDEVTDGTLESFVNASFDDELPLDQATGAAAAYSLRNLSSSYTGNVVDVRRSSDDAEESFTASEVADGPLASFCGQQDITSSLIVPTGVSSHYVITDVIDSSNYTIVANNTPETYWREIRSIPINTGKYRLTCTATITNCTSGGFQLRSNGGDLSDQTTTVLTNGVHQIDLTVNVSGVGNLHWTSGAGTVGTLVVTNLTWELIQADGHVKTWYDQSGSDNHAVQTDTAKQPKIVDAGVLVTDRDGKVALNGRGAKLKMPANAPMLSSDGTYSLFAVVDFDNQRNGNDDFNNIFRFEAKTFGGAPSQRKPMLYLVQTQGGLSASGPSYNAGNTGTTLAEALSVQLLTNIANPALSTGNNTLYADGVLVDSRHNATSVNTETLTSVNTYIFEEQETTVTHFLSEVIYYPSDQSDKRRAIEENIANHYDISLAAFSRDGTVKTWSYQIGTNNDPSSQPKIVVDGSLLTDNTELDSLNEVEVMTVSDPISWNPHNLQLIVDNVTDESIFFDDSSTDRYSLTFKNSATSEQKVEWLKEFNEAQRELKGPTYIDLDESTLSSFEFTAERRYEELITAPYSYYATIDVTDEVSIGDKINAYDAARSGYGDLNQFTTYYQHEEDENELSRKLKVVRPQEIEQFTEQYKTLINS